MDYGLNFLERLGARYGIPNDNWASNYSDPELQYYMSKYLKDYGFIPSRVLRDALQGAQIAYAQPLNVREGATRFPEEEQYAGLIRAAVNKRLGLRNSPKGTQTPTGMDANEMWSAPLSTSDMILKKAFEDEQRKAYPELSPDAQMPVKQYPTRTVGRGDNWLEVELLPYPATFENK